jgi:nickel superoxide dismutase
MKLTMALVAVFIFLMPMASPVFAHCEVPCGIYDDETRCTMIAEHITTIEKSINQIVTLSKEKPLNYNQIVRWVDNKEHHANELQHIVTQYFMTQRLKPVDQADSKADSEYMNKLKLLHQMLVYAMKTKQTVDLENVEKLRSLLAEFRTAHFGMHVH